MTTNWTLQRTVGPVNLPIDLADVKDHLRISSSDTQHNTLLTRHINAAAEQVEQDTGRTAIRATFVQSLDEFEDEILLHRGPLQSVSSVTYYDTDGVQQTLSTDIYGVDTARGMVHRKIDQQWPATNRERNNVAITFVAGYAEVAANVPRLIQEAMLMQIGAWFFDPMMENEMRAPWTSAYERLIGRIMRSSYP